MDGPEANNSEHHDLAVTKQYWADLPERVRRHLHCPVVDELTPITQKHDIEGLVMGESLTKSLSAVDRCCAEQR